MLLGTRVVFTYSGMAVRTAPQPAPDLAKPSSTEGGLGIDPVFQIWSHLWDVDLNGEEEKYYNMTEVRSTLQQHASPRAPTNSTQLDRMVLWRVASCCIMIPHHTTAAVYGDQHLLAVTMFT